MSSLTPLNGRTNPLARGRLLSAADIRTEFFRYTRSKAWVRRTVCPEGRRLFGHCTLRWYEVDVVRWMDGLSAS